MIVGINARFLAAPLGGVQRFAREVSARVLERCDVVLFMPRATDLPSAWQGRVRTDTGMLRSHAWEQLELPVRARRSCDVLLNLANTAPLAHTAPQVVMVHDLLPLTHPHWFANVFSAWYGQLMPRVVRTADHILTTSPHLLGPLRGIVGHGGTPMDIVPQGSAPFDAPASAAAIAAVLAERAIQQPYVLAVGAGEPRKNAAFAVQVMRGYAESRGTVPPLVLVGAAAAHVHASAPRAESSTDVRALGRVNDTELHALYSGAAALLYPTLGEGFGRPPLEALCCGTPVLASMYAQGTQVLEGTGARRLPLDVDVWRHALHAILASGERVPDNVRVMLRTRWSWDAAADVVLAACASVVGRDQRAPLAPAVS